MASRSQGRATGPNPQPFFDIWFGRMESHQRDNESYRQAADAEIASIKATVRRVEQLIEQLMSPKRHLTDVHMGGE